MIELTNTAAVTLTAGQALSFNNVVWKSGCCESFRGTGTAVRAGQGVYRISFSGNVSGETAATPVQLQFVVDGAPLPETIMISTPTAVADINNVSKSTIIGNRGNCCNPNPGSVSISIVNTGTTTLTVQPGANLIVTRIA